MPTELVAPTIEQIAGIENFILQFPQVEMPIANEFCNGLYARTMFIPAGTILTGAVHRSDNFMLVRVGDIIVISPDGGARLKTGEMHISKAGIKRLGYAVQDTLITTFHANPQNETDNCKLWDMYTVDLQDAIECADFNAIKGYL